MEGWDKFIENRIEKDVEILLEKYIMEYSGNVSESDKMDMSITFYELMSLKYKIDY